MPTEKEEKKKGGGRGAGPERGGFRVWEEL